ncbi:hypothetical protein FO519_003001 [Halicephalobus sp. NKZ332]|nr:hypothetical protein FO519_003001 [Halicephalobus sp. NKZ332]
MRIKIKRGQIQIDYLTFILSLCIVSLIVHFFSNHVDEGIVESPKAELNESRNPGFCVDEEHQNCIPPFRKFDNKYRIAEKFNLAACVIEKSMSTVLAAIMCLLHDEQAFRLANRTLTTDMWENRFCKEKNEFNSVKTILTTTKRKLEDLTLFTIVRNPVDRFLSGFVDKCILEKKRNLNPNKCYGCERNITCFLQEEYQRAKKIASGGSLGWSYEDIHFFPQNWHCEMHTYIQYFKFINYRSKTKEEYSKMLEELGGLLLSSGVPGTLVDSVTSELKKTRTGHATVGVPERIYFSKKLKSDKTAMDLLIKLYYYDFVLFGFPFPDVPR